MPYTDIVGVTYLPNNRLAVIDRSDRLIYEGHINNGTWVEENFITIPSPVTWLPRDIEWTPWGLYYSTDAQGIQRIDDPLTGASTQMANGSTYNGLDAFEVLIFKELASSPFCNPMLQRVVSLTETKYNDLNTGGILNPSPDVQLITNANMGAVGLFYFGEPGSEGMGIVGQIGTLIYDASEFAPDFLPTELAPLPTLVTLGDMDCSGFLDDPDDQLFVDALLGTYMGCDVNRADMNQDTFIDGLDTQLYVDARLGN